MPEELGSILQRLVADSYLGKEYSGCNTSFMHGVTEEL